jgi:hypothetical protein
MRAGRSAFTIRNDAPKFPTMVHALDAKGGEHRSR